MRMVEVSEYRKPVIDAAVIAIAWSFASKFSNNTVMHTS